MPSHSPAQHTERARPLLGTHVAIRVVNLPSTDAHALIDQAFSCVAEIHRLMSFHEVGSDLHRINQYALLCPTPVDQRTWQVLTAAQEFSRASAGLFDVTIASALVAAGRLSAISGASIPEAGASWRDIELLPGRHVRFHRPLWVDLGGIAKGYAVDCAIELLRKAGATQACVNAGGDLRVFGPHTERVHLLSAARADVMPVLEISDAAVASSGGDGAHLHGVTRESVDLQSRVSVVAADCMTADALTKVVLGDARLAESLLPQYRAVAYLNDSYQVTNGGWRTLGAPVESSC